MACLRDTLSAFIRLATANPAASSAARLTLKPLEMREEISLFLVFSAICQFLDDIFDDFDWYGDYHRLLGDREREGRAVILPSHDLVVSEGLTEFLEDFVFFVADFVEGEVGEGLTLFLGLLFRLQPLFNRFSPFSALFLDLIIDPVLFEKLVWIRALTVFGFGLVYLANRRDKQNQWAELLGIVTLMFSAASIEVMVLNTGGHKSAYYAGLNLVLLGSVVLMPWHWTRTMLVAAGTVLIYNLGIVLTESISDTVTFATNNFFIFFTGVISVAGSAAAFIVRKGGRSSQLD